ncbi:hypothetical protein HMF8227_02632 [Saliniradius amylolyticus]|uniref:Esterase n=1 Tax=Saliniradius amylolyticus TaxID=2183582 RepID=A0A2S2E601_9ALTE|nr:alpha/beta hydrolase-fold protein [Saliniradius amylolyticus]AWL13084.1 hypothetical protein HMF8227_02632 [Saliniradius amylolyticus]
MLRFIIVTLTLCLALTAQAETPKVSAGKLVRLADFPSEHVPARHVDIWLPPDYSQEQSYAVLYMHDGQMLFDGSTTWNNQEWQVDEVASRLITTGKVQPFIVVGVHNGGANRHSEYFPQRPFQALSKTQRQHQYTLRRSESQKLFNQEVYSDRYLRFLVEELKPYIDAHYSVRTGPAHTFIMGSSMGGLISWYALAEYPRVFGGAACLSTHWPGSFEADNNPIPERFLAYMHDRLPEPEEHRLYFDFGTETLDAMYPPLQARVDNLMSDLGYTERLWQTRKFEGAAHTENDWAKRLHHPLLFLLGN